MELKKNDFKNALTVDLVDIEETENQESKWVNLLLVGVFFFNKLVCCGKAEKSRLMKLYWRTKLFQLQKRVPFIER